MRSATTALRRESDTVSRCLFRPIMQQLDNKRVQVCLFFVNERWQWDLLSQKTVNPYKIKWLSQDVWSRSFYKFFEIILLLLLLFL